MCSRGARFFFHPRKSTRLSRTYQVAIEVEPEEDKGSMVGETPTDYGSIIFQKATYEGVMVGQTLTDYRPL